MYLTTYGMSGTGLPTANDRGVRFIKSYHRNHLGDADYDSSFNEPYFTIVKDLTADEDSREADKVNMIARWLRLSYRMPNINQGEGRKSRRRKRKGRKRRTRR